MSREVRKSALLTITVVMLFQVSGLFFREWASRELINNGIPPGTARLLSAWVGFVAVAVLLSPVLAVHRDLWLSRLAWPKNPGYELLNAVMVGVALRLTSWGIVILQFAPPDPIAAGHFLVASPDPWKWGCPDIAYSLLFIATLALATPVIEEIISRGIILGRLLAKHRSVAIPVSAVLFAVLHAPADIPLAFAFGMVAGVMRVNSGSLTGPVVAHGTVNALLLLMPGCFDPEGLTFQILILPAPVRVLIGITLLAAPLWFAFQRASRTGAGR